MGYLVIKQQERSAWKTYNFTGSSYITSGPISFKYPSNWNLKEEFYTTPGGTKEIISITLTSPDGIEQIAFSNGGRQAELNCDMLLKQNAQEPRGKIECKMINRTPFYLTYTTNTESVTIYNQIISSVVSTSPTSTVQSKGPVSETPSITVLSPNGGETWNTGQTNSITWKSSGLEKVDIGYIQEGSGFEFAPIMKNVQASLGVYSWKIPTSILSRENKSGSFKIIIAITILLFLPILVLPIKLIGKHTKMKSMDLR